MTYLATNVFPADGTTTYWDFSFAGVAPDTGGVLPYLYAADVKALELYKDSEGNAAAAARTVYIDPALPLRANIVGLPVAAGRQVKIYRSTEIRYPLVDYRDRQTVSEFDLDLANRQAIFIAQETQDASQTALALDKNDNYDVQDHRIVNLAPGVDPTDAVNVRQLGHAIRIPESEAVLAPLPGAAGRAGRVLSFDALGIPTLAFPSSESALELAIRLASPTPGDGADILGWTSSADGLPTTVAQALEDAFAKIDDAEGDTTALRNALSTVVGQLVQASVVFHRGRTVSSVFDFIGVSPLSFGAPGGVGDALPALLAARDFARINRVPLTIDSFFAVYDTFVIEDFNGLVMNGSGAIRNYSSTAQYVLDIKNCTGVTIGGNITIDGNSMPNIVAATRVWASGQAGGVNRTCSLHHLKLDNINAACAWQIGDFASPDHLISEIKLSGTTYNTPVGLLNIGSQAVVNISDMDLVAAGQGIFATYSHSLIINHGGLVIASNSELQMPLSTSGFALVNCPIDSPAYDNSYGKIILTGCPIETPSILFLAYNPRGVPSPAPGTGGLVMSNCGGYHNIAEGVASFQGSPDFTGKVYVGSNLFFRLTQKASPNTAFSAGAYVRISDEWADDFFVKGLAGQRGGINLFDHRVIFSANSLGGMTFTGSGATTPLAFQSYAGSGDNVHFYGQYSAASGIFTVPAGGLNSVEVNVGIVNAQPAAGSALQVRVGSTTVAASGCNSNMCNAYFAIGDLPAGAQLSFHFLNAGPTFADTNTNLDRLVISARR